MIHVEDRVHDLFPQRIAALSSVILEISRPNRYTIFSARLW